MSRPPKFHRNVSNNYWRFRKDQLKVISWSSNENFIFVFELWQTIRLPSVKITNSHTNQARRDVYISCITGNATRSVNNVLCAYRIMMKFNLQFKSWLIDQVFVPPGMSAFFLNTHDEIASRSCYQLFVFWVVFFVLPPRLGSFDSGCNGFSS